MKRYLLLMMAAQIMCIIQKQDLALILITLGGLSYLYFQNNPLNHSKAFRWRSYWNWLPMGLLYAFLYMGRYNLTVSKTALGDLMTKEDFGLIFMAGTWTYGVSFLVNGPLVDRVGGKLGMLIGGTGSALANIAMGLFTYLLLTQQVHNAQIDLLFWPGDATLSVSTLMFSILYSVNMYFQSYGAVSIVKVNAHWFHVKERGVFSGIFGTIISLGIFFAFGWGSSIVQATKASVEKLGFFETWLRHFFWDPTLAVDQTWMVFFIPAGLLMLAVFVEAFLLKDRPSETGFQDFDTGDASSGEMDDNPGVFEIVRRMVTNPIILTIAIIEFCSGVVRNGIMHWYLIFLAENKVVGSALFFKQNWGALLFLAGSFGGFFTGILSDKLFQSRRGPSAVFNYVGILLACIVMCFTLWDYPIILGCMVILASFLVVGIHGLLSGTATMDFGGRKGAATAVGIVDGFVYLGTGLQSVSIGFIASRDWSYWPVFLIPFCILAVFMSTKIWRAFPNAKRKGSA